MLLYAVTDRAWVGKQTLCDGRSGIKGRLHLRSAPWKKSISDAEVSLRKRIQNT